MSVLYVGEEKMNELRIAIAAEFELCEKISACLEQSALPINQLSLVEIYPFNEEQGVRFQRRAVAQLSVDEAEWSEFNYLLFAGEVNHAELLAKAADAGCVVVDLKGVCALLPDVPLVVPTVNNEQLNELRQRNIVSLPDPQVSQLALALNALMADRVLNQLLVTSLLPASYINSETVSQLAGQTARLLNGLPIEEAQQRLAFDVFPFEASNLTAQLQKIFPQLEKAIFHQIRVPVFYGIAQKVTALSDYEWNYEHLTRHWHTDELIQYEDLPITPVTNGEKENDEQAAKLHIGRLKPIDSTMENGIEFWSVADDQRFNLALLSVKLLETVYQQGY